MGSTVDNYKIALLEREREEVISETLWAREWEGVGKDTLIRILCLKLKTGVI